jgi:hypothetical protein
VGYGTVAYGLGETSRVYRETPASKKSPPGPLEPGARPNRGGGGGCARALAVYKPPPKTKKISSRSFSGSSPDSARGTCGTCPPTPTQTLPAGPRSTAPKGAREGPDSLFTGDRRQPINEELLGATFRGGSARHCSEMVHCVV